jgi:hypothetical protein
MMKVLGASFDDYEWEDAAPANEPSVIKPPYMPTTLAANPDGNWDDANERDLAAFRKVTGRA